MLQLSWSRLTTLCALLCTIAPIVVSLNPYHVIGVAKTASVTEIKRAYKSMARKLYGRGLFTRSDD